MNTRYDRLFDNKIMFIRISFLYGRNNPIVEFQRVYSSTWYELDTTHKADRIQRIISKYTEDISHYVRNNQLVVSVAI